MRFLQPPPPREPAPPPDRPVWRWLLMAAAAGAVLGAMRPWLCVRFTGLFGNALGPPGWQSTSGFTCLCSGALVLVLALAETGSPTSMRAVRPGTMVLGVLCMLVVGAEWLVGPGTLRGVSAAWTPFFYAVLASAPVLLVASTARWRVAQAQPE